MWSKDISNWMCKYFYQGWDFDVCANSCINLFFLSKIYFFFPQCIEYRNRFKIATHHIVIFLNEFLNCIHWRILRFFLQFSDESHFFLLSFDKKCNLFRDPLTKYRFLKQSFYKICGFFVVTLTKFVLFYDFLTKFARNFGIIRIFEILW